MRRQPLILLALLLILTAVLVPGCGSAPRSVIAAGRGLNLFVATDIHYLAEGINDHGEAFKKYIATGDGRQYEDMAAITEAFVRDVSQAGPDVLIISGDLTNNGERESHVELAQKLKRIEDAAGTRVFVIPGNHDIQNPYARGFKESRQFKTDSVSSSDFARIYRDFGYGEAIARDRSTLSYLAAPSEDLWLMMLDTCVYQDNEELGAPAAYGRIGPETFDWIRSCARLAKERNARIVTVMHHNLLVHTLTMRSGYTLDSNEAAIDVFRACGLNLVLSGHIHIQDIEVRKDGGTAAAGATPAAAGEATRTAFQAGMGPLTEIVTSALIVNPIQYGILKFDPTQGFDYRTAAVDVAGWARATGSTDENLKDFPAYARAHFAGASYQRTLRRLTDAGFGTEAERQLMAETSSLLNVNFFAGTVDTVRAEVLKSKGYSLWRDAAELDSLSGYLNGMLYDDGTPNTRLTIPFGAGHGSGG